MAGSLFEFTFGEEEKKTEKKVQGIALAEVINVLDSLTEGRVQLRLPWMPGVEPWARVAATSAGMGYGHYFLPQVGNEVVVAFNQGDIAEPVVLGALWSKTDRPPSLLATDPMDKRMIRTQSGHTIELDESQLTVTIQSATGQKIQMTPKATEISVGMGRTKITLESGGKISIEAAAELSMNAPKVSITGGSVEVKATGKADLKAAGICTVTGSTVKIN